VASDSRSVPARTEVAPEACPAPGVVVEGAPARLVGAPLQPRRARAAENRGEGAGELPLEALHTRAPDRCEVDEVPAVGILLELRTHREAAGDGIQLGQLSGGERTTRGDGIGEAIEQAVQLIEGLAGEAVVEEADECLVRVVRNALLCQRPLHELSSSSWPLSPSAAPR
jgi:hypothetical protein